MSHATCYAIVPAAGLGLRMGQQHKLLLPWKGATIIDQVLGAWCASQVHRIAVVARRTDLALQVACRKWPVDLVLPEADPADMRASIQHALEHVAATYRPRSWDRWFVAPADLPLLSARIINQLVAASETEEAIAAPRFGERSGHPVSFPWSMACKLSEIPEGHGVNWLLENHPVQWLHLPVGDLLEDIDTPQDYHRMRVHQDRS